MSFDNDDYIPENGALFNFGEIGCDELISKIWIKNDPMKEVCCGDDYVILITASGRVFSYGKNDWGQLGLGHCNTIMNPTSIKSLKNSNEKAVHVGCGRSHTLISTESNRLFAFGSNSEGQLGLDNSVRSVSDPTEVTAWCKERIKQLSAGGEFSAALTENGDLYVWGTNSEGQLGINDLDEDGLWQPRHLKFFASPVTSMCCGAYHMGAISSKVLYMWGEASDGKLGLGDSVTTNQSFPQKVRIESAVKQLACGNNHTTCLTLSGELYTWGQGESGQIGLGPAKTYADRPTQVRLPSITVNSYGDNGAAMEKFVQLSAGERHTAVINAVGLIFMFGDGRHGKLGNLGGSNSYSNWMWPTLVEKFNNDLWAEDVDCGGCHSVVLIRHRRTNEQLDNVSSSYPSSSMDFTSRSNLPDNGSSRGRRHRKNNMNTENGTDDSNLPTLKASLRSTNNEVPKRREDIDTEVEERISNVKSTNLESTPTEKHEGSPIRSSADDLDKIKRENPKNDSDSLNAKVDKFSEIMDSVYGDGSANNLETTDEIVRKRQKKKRKIKQPQSNPQIDQSVWNHNLSSDNEEKNGDNGTSTDNKSKIDSSANPEVAKIGCQPSCRGNQKSKTCTLV